MRILVVNSGSSSLKLRVLDGDRVVAAEDLPAVDEIDGGSLSDVLGAFGDVDAAGHRIVHGGESFTDAVLIDDAVEASLRDLADLAPLHQPKSLEALDLVRAVLPGVKAVACFDTAFHATMPPAAFTYAVPRDWRQRYAVRRYGFHGLSHSYAVRRAGELSGEDPARLRIVTCHLGAGASLAAARGGVSVDTTMGFTPLDGLVMATRSGSVDPGLVLWLQSHEGISGREVAEALEHRSGLLALAGTPDMREILARAGRGDPSSALALDVYVHRLAGSIAAMAAAAGGLDVLVFTGGVGENAPEVRARACGRLRFLGVALDPAANEEALPDAEVGSRKAAVRTFVVEAREDLEIASQVRRVLGPT